MLHQTFIAIQTIQQVILLVANGPNNQQAVILNEKSKETHLVCSIVNFLCCGMFLGVPALILSCQVSEQFNRDDTSAGIESAKCAKYLNIAGFTLSSIAIITVLLIVIVLNEILKI